MNEPDDTTFTVDDATLTWTYNDGFVVHMNGQDIPVIVDLDTMTARLR